MSKPKARWNDIVSKRKLVIIMDLVGPKKQDIWDEVVGKVNGYVKDGVKDMRQGVGRHRMMPGGTEVTALRGLDGTLVSSGKS